MLDIEIENIEVTVSGEDWDRERLVREVKWHLERALEEVARQQLPFEADDEYIERLELPSIDWDTETDKTGTLVSLLVAALQAGGRD